ncbi:19889_t:CDS:2 [Gigaspora rosea]|nr:19889_t:CDS:2 [Gigaspora rosea]
MVEEDAFKLSFSEIFEFSKHIDELISSSKETIDDDNKIFYDLAHKSLWGNATDLSMLPNFGTNNKVEIKQSKSEKTILVNDLEKAWKWLSKYRYVSEVHFHVKSFPCYVSDTSLDDFNWLLKTLKSNDFFSSASEIEKSSLKKLVNQKVPDLYADLCKSHLVIFKGDLNYRRLVYDCKWETTTSFKEAISPLANSKNTLPLLSLRTGKSDVFVGLDEGVEERLGPDRSWMYSRKYAVIQFIEN